METHQLYKNILENIYDGVYFVDKDRKITFWNKGAERILAIFSGIDKKSLLKKSEKNQIANRKISN